MNAEGQASGSTAPEHSGAPFGTDHTRLHLIFQDLHGILESSPAPVVFTDPAGLIEYANPRFCEAVGYIAQELIGRSIADLTVSTSADEEAQQTLACGRRWNGEVTLRRKDGGSYIALASISPILSMDGRPERFIGIHAEITDQRDAEERLAERDAHWKALLQAAPSFIGTVDRDSRIRSINRVAEGADQADVEGSSAYDYLAPEYHDLWRDALAAVFEKGEAQSIEYSARRGPDGPFVWWHSAIGAVAGHNGIQEAMVITTDRSARKLAESALAEREAYWRALIESAPVFIVTLDAEGRITSVNRELDGGKPEEAVGNTVYDFAEESAHAQIREALRRVFSQGEVAQLENRASLTSGEVRWWSYTIGPVKDEGRVVGAVLVSHDITERRTAEEQLRLSESRWRALLENAPDYILIVGRDGAIQHLNRAADGGAPERFVGRSLFDYADEDSHEEWRSALERVFTLAERTTVETLSRNMGEQRWFASSIGPVCEGSEVRAAVVVGRDTTARRMALERLRAFATAVSDLIVVIGEDGVLLEVLGPQQGHGLLPADPETLRGTRIADHMSQDQADWAMGFVEATIKGGRTLDEEGKFRLASGAAIYVRGRSAPLTLDDGRRVAVVHVSDITEQKRMEEELAALREEVETLAEERQGRAAELGLTFRELTVLSLIARGCSDKEIAGLLGVSPFTVNKQSASAVRKLAARSRSEAVAKAVRAGVI